MGTAEATLIGAAVTKGVVTAVTTGAAVTTGVAVTTGAAVPITERIVTGAAIVLNQDGNVPPLRSARTVVIGTVVIEVVPIAIKEMEAGVVMTSRMKN